MTGERPSRGWSLAVYLAAFAAVLALPPMMFAAIATWRFATAEAQRLESAAIQRNAELVRLIDAVVSARIGVLEALATSPAIDSADYARFDRQARSLSEQGMAIRLRDPEGNILVDTGLSVGVPLGQLSLIEPHHRALSQMEPVVTNLFTSRRDAKPWVGIISPAVREGRPRYLITTAFDPRYFAAMLARSGIEAPYFASLVDRNGVIIARSEAHEQSVGQRLPGFDLASGPSGTWSGFNPSGVLVSGFYQRSTVSGWMVTMGVDQTALRAPLVRSLWLLGGVGAALLLVSAVLALGLVRRLKSASTSLTDAAEAVIRGGLTAVPQTPVTEVNHVGRAFAEVSRRLSDQAAALETANRGLEQRVEERTRALALSEARYRLLAEAISDIVLLRSQETATIEYISPAVSRVLGYDPAELIGRPRPDLIHPDDLEELKRVNRTVSPEAPHALSIHRMRHRDGHWVWVQNAYTLLPATSESEAKILAVIRDDTERQLSEAKLQQGNAALKQFSAIVSHDLQAPLRHIAMFAEMLQAHVDGSSPESAEYVRRISASVERMMRLIRSLVAYTAVAYAEVKSDGVDLNQVMADAMALLEGEIRDSGATISLFNLPRISGDADLLVHLFQNLIANALKYRSEAPPLVKIRARRTGQLWEIAVEDNGIGIDPQYAERVFEIFKRLHRDESRYPGMGVGLALARRIVESHNGEIGLDPSYSQGARIVLTLPARDVRRSSGRVGDADGHA
ncbi:PAS domain S-box protein [Phreatobacter aquaticus]|uniref:histidine kinase n=1 Tax=Phreatobacter aquaticus TaxID=2570229 RepID=A0A4D7QL86_9HYPH|nr:ATP-binding protein [Phreatobacter aquaticus]QCK86449.1 PAS domain S-box protein [Phreatobacter aquaticus]